MNTQLSPAPEWLFGRVRSSDDKVERWGVAFFMLTESQLGEPQVEPVLVSPHTGQLSPVSRVSGFVGLMDRRRDR